MFISASLVLYYLYYRLIQWLLRQTEDFDALPRSAKIILIGLNIPAVPLVWLHAFRQRPQEKYQ